MKRALVAILILLAGAVLAEEPQEITAENVVALMNAQRMEHGLGPLKTDPRLIRAAEDRMKDMEDGGWWGHESPEGRSPFVWLNVQAYDYQYAGENLAAGFETANVLVSSWMESPGHRANILNADFDDCGIAIIEGSTVRPASGKSVVVMFGRRR